MSLSVGVWLIVVQVAPTVKRCTWTLETQQTPSHEGVCCFERKAETDADANDLSERSISVPVDIQGKTYWTVAERLTLAHGDEVKPVGIKSIETSLETAGNVIVVRAVVTFADGRFFTGMSMVNADSRSPAERSAPLETCETSSVGRALAMAGYFGSPEGIAGAEELHLAQERSEARMRSFPDGSSGVTRGPGGPPAGSSGAAPRPAVGAPYSPGGGGGGVSNPASAAQVRFATKLWSEAGRPLPPPDFTTYSMRDMTTLIDELKGAAAG